MNKSTSWGKVAIWYDNYLSKNGTYQKDLILPNILRLLTIKKNETVLDLACGQGFFTGEFAKIAGKTIGVDLSEELISLAKKHLPSAIDYRVGSADNLSFLNDKSVDKITIILSLQNIENVSDTLKECSRVLKQGGKLYIVLNHPAFRIPKNSSWGWNEKNKSQYRRIDSYLSESKVKIQMHPGDNPKEVTWSFHRPIQYYVKLLSKNGFLVYRMEEWNSNKKSEPGPKAEEENRIRSEIPLFLFIEGVLQ